MSFHIFSHRSRGRLWYNRAMQGDFEYIGLGFVPNDHLAVLPFIPVDTKMRMLSHAILGGGPAGHATAAALGRRACIWGDWHPPPCSVLPSAAVCRPTVASESN